ncbi:MAG: hypothetical protein MAG581_01277 [Deltaproteobacteria bacterium]|jgi:plasmid stabilization system protein ParE|nr:hypothetical protein [Deltaproteobacteria bacterium]
MIFHPDVEEEITASYNWYEIQSEGLGEDFLKDLENAFQTIKELPETWPKFQYDFRRYILSRFPFSVIYRRFENEIYVVAVMHQSRRHGYWKDRVLEDT